MRTLFLSCRSATAPEALNYFKEKGRSEKEEIAVRLVNPFVLDGFPMAGPRSFVLDEYRSLG